ncbi:MAG: hypothetical protein Q4C16_01155, partial [Eubacteriales bacterium]|nr:hypothetical protein [Eubacteriales bacterium]
VWQTEGNKTVWYLTRPAIIFIKMIRESKESAGPAYNPGIQKTSAPGAYNPGIQKNQRARRITRAFISFRESVCRYEKKQED